MHKLPQYYGIKRGYPRLKRLISEKISAYIQLIRVFTLLGAWMAGFFLDVLFSKPYLNLSHSFLVGMTLAFLQAGGQSFNQSIREEVEIDKMNGKVYRPTVSGRMSLKEGKIISSILFLCGILLAFSLNVNYGMLSILIAFFAVAYTSPPFRIKKRFFLNNLWQGVARGLLPAIYVASAHQDYGLLPVFYGIMLAVWVTGAQASKDFPDLRGDRVYGIQTFPVKLGVDGALKLMSILIFSGFVILNFLILSSSFPINFLVLNILAIPSALVVYGSKKNIVLKFAENNLSWCCFYGTLGLFYMLPVLLI